MKRIHRGHDSYGPIELADAIGRREGLSLDDDESIGAILERIASEARAAADNPVVMHGRRVEAMFGYVAASLGGCLLVKREDAGDAFVEDTHPVVMPDYRVLLKTGEEFLIEVKNCHVADPARPLRLRDADIVALQRYATLSGRELKFGIYWSRWRHWTLVPCTALALEGSKRTISFIQAIKRNEMAQLGDIAIGTVPPLLFRVWTDPAKPRTIGNDGKVEFTIGRVQIYAGHVEVTDDSERSFAMYLMFYGRWMEDKPLPKVEGNELVAIDFVARPEEYDPKQGFAIVGNLSEMITSRYNDLTVKGQVIKRLAPSVAPGSLGFRIPGKVTEMTMPLWVLYLRPASEA